MACSMIKKGVLSAALGAGALYAAFGTSAPGYVRTAFHNFRHSVKHNVPVQFEIDNARNEINRLEPAIRDNIENLARATVDAEHLERQVVEIRGNMAKEKEILTSLKAKLTTGDTKLAGNLVYTTDEIKADLKGRFDQYKQVNSLLKDKEETLKSKQKSILAAKQQLAQMAITKQKLLTQIASIEARLKMIQTTQESNEFNFDDSALSRAKASVNDLEKRLDVMARTAEMEGKFAGSSIPVIDEPGRDILREIDAEFAPASSSKPAPADEKSL